VVAEGWECERNWLSKRHQGTLERDTCAQNYIVMTDHVTIHLQQNSEIPNFQ
jgi:hypothetical protein